MKDEGVFIDLEPLSVHEPFAILFGYISGVLALYGLSLALDPTFGLILAGGVGVSCLTLLTLHLLRPMTWKVAYGFGLGLVGLLDGSWNLKSCVGYSLIGFLIAILIACAKPLNTITWIFPRSLTSLHGLVGLAGCLGVLFGMSPSLLLQTSLVYILLASFRAKPEERDQVIGTCLLLLLLVQFLTSLQGSFWMTLAPAKIGSLRAFYGFMTPMGCIIAGVSIIRVLHMSDNLNATAHVVAGYIIPLGLVLYSIYWVINTLQGFPLFLSKYGDWMNLVSFILVRIGFFATSISSLYVWLSDPSSMGIEFVQLVDEKDPKLTRKQLMIRGLANVVGSGTFVMTCAVFMALQFSQHPQGSLVLCSLLLIIIQIVDLYHLWRDKIVLMDWKDLKNPPKPSMADRIKKLKVKPREGLDQKVKSKEIESKDALYRAQATPGLSLLFSSLLIMLGKTVQSVLGHKSSLESARDSFAYYYQNGTIQNPFTDMSEPSDLSLLITHVFTRLQFVSHVYSSDILIGMALPLLMVWKRPFIKGRETGHLAELAGCVLYFCGFSGLDLFLSMVKNESVFIQWTVPISVLGVCIGLIGSWTSLYTLIAFQTKIQNNK